MQTILGSGGAIGIELAKALKEYTTQIRLVSRNPGQVNATDELLPGDLTNPSDVDHAVKGSEVAYLTVGFPYRLKVWKTMWPKTMENVLKACEKHDVKLVFFDNIYMYDKDHLNGMDEDTPVRPPSEKGKIRAFIANMLMEAVEKGKIDALIARSADFYGPSIQTSVLTEVVFKPLATGKKANWLGALDCPHAFTYTPDAGKATAILGNTRTAYNQVWHLPTAGNPPTGREWIERIAAALGTSPSYRKVSKCMTRLIGLFDPTLRELVEMYYQYDRDYVFDSGKFEKQFGFRPTSYGKGIQNIVETDYRPEVMR